MKNLFLFTTIVFMLAACNNNDQNSSDGNSTTKATPVMSFSIVASYPHDPTSFTQGLAFYKGDLYEGTGDFGRSKLMQVDLKTGKAIRTHNLDSIYFGEGITILNDTIYQLTWKNNVVFVYSVKDFKKIKEFSIPHEGWGLTHDGQSLIASDGSNVLYYYDPKTFTLQKKLEITEDGVSAFNLNELEFINGFIYVNQWQAPYIHKIDPSNGHVVAKADLNSVWDRIKAKAHDSDVPNGIAYDDVTKKIYVTGKRWPELYEITF